MVILQAAADACFYKATARMIQNTHYNFMLLPDSELCFLMCVSMCFGCVTFFRVPQWFRMQSLETRDFSRHFSFLRPRGRKQLWVGTKIYF